MEMTPRERLTALFNNEPTDRLSSTELVTNYYIKGKPQYPDVLHVHEEIGGDIIYRIKSNIFKVSYTGGVERRENIVDGKTVVAFDTPVGSIQEVYAPPKPWADLPVKIEHFIKTVEDYKIYQYVFEHTVLQENFEWYAYWNKLIGDNGIVVPTFTPFFRSAFEATIEDDIQQTVFDLMDYPEIVEEFLAVRRETNRKACRIAAKCPALAFNCWEDTSTTLLSPQLYEDYILPEMNDYADIMHENGKKFIHHACGRLHGLRHLIKNEHVDCMESITPPKTGDMTPKDCFDAWGDKFLVIGGVDPMFLLNCTMEELETYLIETIESIGDHKKRFILQNADSLPPQAPIEKLKFICEFGKRYKF